MLMQLSHGKKNQYYTEGGCSKENIAEQIETEEDVCKNRITSDYRMHKVHQTVIQRCLTRQVLNVA